MDYENTGNIHRSHRGWTNSIDKFSNFWNQEVVYKVSSRKLEIDYRKIQYLINR